MAPQTYPSYHSYAPKETSWSLATVADRGRVIICNIYDALNRLIQRADAASYPTSLPALGYTPLTTFTYDANDNVISTADPLNHLTPSAYDGLNRVVSTMDARGGITTMAYDFNYNMTSPRAPVNNLTVCLYDAVNRKVKLTDPTAQHNTTTFGDNAY